MAAKRRLNRDVIDQFQGLTPEGQLIPAAGPMGSGLPAAIAGMSRVRNSRMQERFGNRAARHFSTVLPSQAWDGFFGAMQNRRDLVNAAGGDFDVDLQGDPSTGEGGIGRTKIMDLNERVPYDVRSLRALERVAKRKR